jgi:two-component system cell cycle response regulator
MYRVLHIENSNFIRKVFNKLITENGASYTGVNTYEAAWEELRSENYSMIVTATELSDGKAINFLEEINKSEFESLPIIVLTSSDSLMIKEKLFNLGIVNYVLKKNLKSETINEYFYAVTHRDSLLEKIQRTHIGVVDSSSNTMRIIKRLCKLNQISNLQIFYSHQEMKREGMDFPIIIYNSAETPQDLTNLKQLKRDFPNSEVIAMTEISHYTTLPKLLENGADDFIVKPFNMNIFINRLKAAVKRI